MPPRKRCFELTYFSTFETITINPICHQSKTESSEGDLPDMEIKVEIKPLSLILVQLDKS
jgi:hypothetical protein